MDDPIMHDVGARAPGVGVQRVRKTTIALVGVLFVWASVPSVAAACEVCWGAALDNPTTRAISAAMLLLVGMTGLVVGGIGAFFLRLRRRTRLLGRGGSGVNGRDEVGHPPPSGDRHRRGLTR